MRQIAIDIETFSPAPLAKWAHNAAFERVALSAWLQRHHPELLAAGFLDPSQWRCTMVWSA